MHPIRFWLWLEWVLDLRQKSPSHSSTQDREWEVAMATRIPPNIIKTDSDWAFILKVDALLESAAKHIVGHGLQIQLLKQTFRNGALDDFIDSLSMNGRTSLLKLLEASALPEEELRFVEVTRLVRNSYAHNIEYADLSLTQLIKSR